LLCPLVFGLGLEGEHPPHSCAPARSGAAVKAAQHVRRASGRSEAESLDGCVSGGHILAAAVAALWPGWTGCLLALVSFQQVNQR